MVADAPTRLTQNHSGPYNYQTEIVSHLDKAGAAGTFFLNGNNCTLRSKHEKQV